MDLEALAQLILLSFVALVGGLAVYFVVAASPPGVQASEAVGNGWAFLSSLWSSFLMVITLLALFAGGLFLLSRK